jgi:hypothetical protein
MRFYFLTYHGTFIGRAADGETVSQLPLYAIFQRERLASIDVDVRQVRETYDAFIAETTGDTVAATVRHIGDRLIHLNPNRKTISVENNGLYLCAEPDGRAEENRGSVNLWESFVACSDDDLDVIAMIMKSPWIQKSSRRIIDGATLTSGENFALVLGGLNIPLAHNLPFDLGQPPFRLLVLIDGWRIDELVLYKPLIYYLAFGDDNVFEQLAISLQSLIEIGRYKGDVLVFSDRSHEAIARDNPWLPPDRLLVASNPAKDWVGFVAGKYCIIEEKLAYDYQPVIYMDPDIIYDMDAEDLLVSVAVADRLCAPLETFSRLADSPAVGSTLLQLDHAEPRFACGFNGGTIGIPNLPAHRHTLELIRRIISNYSSMNGRGIFKWVDQEAANYVSYKIAHFDTREMSQFVRFSSTHSPVPVEPRRGAIHFWGVLRVNRPRLMRVHLAAVVDVDRLVRQLESARSQR